MTPRQQRLGAYGVCVEEGHVLLSRFVSSRNTERYWSLPGGGVEHGEEPIDAVVRETAEETGYEVAVESLLGVDSRPRSLVRDGRVEIERHNVGVFYRVRVTGGELRHETDGSSDRAAWVPLAQVPDLPRGALVDTGLELDRLRPANGRVPPAPPGGLVH